jgi:hypothetical protein
VTTGFVAGRGAVRTGGWAAAVDGATRAATGWVAGGATTRDDAGGDAAVVRGRVAGLEAAGIDEAVEAVLVVATAPSSVLVSGDGSAR